MDEDKLRKEVRAVLEGYFEEEVTGLCVDEVIMVARKELEDERD